MSKKITLNQLFQELSKNTAISKSRSQEFIYKLIESILDSINKTGKATITNFGRFTVVEVEKRAGVNPKTGEPIVIPAHKRITFSPYKALEDKVNRDFLHLQAQILDSNIQKDDPDKTEENRLTDDVDSTFESLFSHEINEESETTLAIEQENSEKNKPTNDYAIPPSVTDNNFNLSKLSRFNTLRPKATSWTPAILLSVLIILSISIWATLFFLPYTDKDNVLKATNASAFGNEEIGTRESEFDDQETQTIPMIPSDGDITKKPKEVITFKNQDSQVILPQESASEYRVEKGTWIYDIARKKYGNTLLWPLIFQTNYSITSNPDLIKPDSVLIIPKLEGSAVKPTANDYDRLVKATIYVAQAYKNCGKYKEALAYFKAAKQYNVGYTVFKSSAIKSANNSPLPVNNN